MTKRFSLGLLLLLAAGSVAPRTAHAQDIDACINASEKALTLRKAEKLIDARKTLSVCAASTCPDAVRTSCQQRLADVIKAIPSIVFATKDSSGHDVAAVKLTIDGAAYADHLDGSAILLDPGEHQFRFETAGQPPVVQRFVLHQNEQNRRETIVLGTASTTATPPPAAGGTGSPATNAATDSGGSSDGSTQRTIGLVVGGVGLAGVVAGGIFGVLSISAHNNYENNCGSKAGLPSGDCNTAGVSGENDAAAKGNLSTGFFIGGGIVTVVGAALFLFAPSGPAGAQVGVGPGSVVVAGRF
jgi:hypothetical protein